MFAVKLFLPSYLVFINWIQTFKLIL